MSQSAIVKALITAQGCLYSREIGANIARDTPQELFHWLLGALLLSARINADQAVQAAKALRGENLHKIDVIREADRARLVRVLNQNGYARFDEKTTDQIRAAAVLVGDRYDGDLRQLRDAPDNAAAVLKALTEVKGIGPAGAAIFAREAQLVWDVFYPRADGPAIEQARKLDLPETAGDLAALAGGREAFVQLVAALTRAALDGPADAVRKAAS